MTRWIALLIVFTLPGAAVAAETSPAPGLGKLPCDWQPPVGDRLDVSCPLEASGTTQRFRFKANFSGGHDDTMASMTPALDGSPLVCDEGSKTDLFGEDGDVSLECRFSMTEKAGTKHVLGVKLKWSHAQYTDFQFGSD